MNYCRSNVCNFYFVMKLRNVLTCYQTVLLTVSPPVWPPMKRGQGKTVLRRVNTVVSVWCIATDWHDIDTCTMFHGLTLVVGASTIAPPVTSTVAAPKTDCLYRGTTYKLGDVWQDGCQYNCTCGAGRAYRCSTM